MEPLPHRLYPFLMHFIKQQKWGFITLMVCHFAWAIDQTVFPYVMKMLTDSIIAIGDDRSNMWQQLFVPLVFGGALWLGVEVMFRGYDFLVPKVFPTFEASIRRSMFSYVSGHSYAFYANNFAGSMGNRISDITGGATRIMEMVLTTFIPSVVALVIALVMFALFQPIFASILLAWVVIHIGVALLASPQCNALSEKHSAKRTTLMGHIVDSFTNHNNVRLFARKNYEERFIDGYQYQEKLWNNKTLFAMAKVRFVQGVMCFLLQGVAMTWYTLDQWQAGHINVGDVIYIFFTTGNITLMAWISGSQLPFLFREIGLCRQALVLVAIPQGVASKDNAKPLQVSDGRIQFSNVTFGYNPHKALFSSLNVAINAGEKVGLVGLSGSGKTSFVHLILRLFDVNKGRITIDKKDIKHVTIESLRRQISFIPQDPLLFHRSIMDNIRYGDVQVSEDRVLEASQLANCDEFIKQMRQGYDTLVGERGVKLSGGQRQRIAIARAFLKDAPILILDEATSALDSVTEHHIQDACERLMAGRTTIVVAHRLSTLQSMDRILVFDQGVIVEDGSHETLLKQKGHYWRLWNMQVGGFLHEDCE